MELTVSSRVTMKYSYVLSSILIGRAIGFHLSGLGIHNRRVATRLCAENETPDDGDRQADSAAMEKALKAMTAFTNKYLEISDTKLCSDKSVPAVVIKGLAEHKVSLGSPLCPCRFYDDKEKEAKDGFWNCPCVPMRERQECHCMLFLPEENPFAGTEVKISYDEVIDASKGFDK